MATHSKSSKGTVPDIVEIDLSKDGDICNLTELNEMYQQPYHCSLRKAIGLEKLFIQHMDCNWSCNRLATALSNNSIHIAALDTLEKIATFPAHNDNIIDVHFSSADVNCVFSGSSDGSIRLWDVRNPRKHSQEFRDDDDQRVKPLMSFDINCKGQFLCAGTEKVKDDSYLLFWDIRSTKHLGGYCESHQDDVSHVQFHPTEPDTLASCSTDCLINIFDISQSDEDDALQFSLNAETSCGRLQWLREKPTKDLSVITHTEDIQIWDIEEGTPRHSFSRDQIKTALKRKNAETCYSVRCFHSGTDESDPLVLAGSSTPHRGCLRLLRIKEGKLEPHAILYDKNGANSQVVRCATFNPLDGTVVSGGEDGIINVWSQGAEKLISSANPMVDVPSRKGRSSNSRKPYAK